MTDIENVIDNLEKTAEYFRYLQSVGLFGDQPVFREHENHCNDAIAALKKQESVITQYHKADAFLAIHGWKWAKVGETNA